MYNMEIVNQIGRHTALRCILSGLFASSIFGQVTELTDKRGKVWLTISEIKIFRYSEMLKEQVPDIRGIVTNVSGENLFDVSIEGGIHKNNGSVVKFVMNPLCPGAPCEFERGIARQAECQFLKPFPFTTSTFEFVDFVMSANHHTTQRALLVSGFLAKDRGCLNDFVATASLSGVALRKRLAELIQYECGMTIDRQEAELVSPLPGNAVRVKLQNGETGFVLPGMITRDRITVKEQITAVSRK